MAAQLPQGQNRPIWIVDLKTYDLVSPPWADSNVDPAWVGETVSSPIATASPYLGVRHRQAADSSNRFNDFDVKTLDTGAGTIVFEQVAISTIPRTAKTIVNITANGDFRG
jgi:hypothetical protein